MRRRYSPWGALPRDVVPEPEPCSGGWLARVAGWYSDGSPFAQYELGDANGRVPVYGDYEQALQASIRLLRFTPRVRGGR